MSNFNSSDSSKIKNFVDIDANFFGSTNKNGSRMSFIDESVVLDGKDNVEVLNFLDDIQDDKVLDVLDTNFKKNRDITKKFNQELYRRINDEIVKLAHSEENGRNVSR